MNVKEIIPLLGKKAEWRKILYKCTYIFVAGVIMMDN